MIRAAFFTFLSAGLLSGCSFQEHPAPEQQNPTQLQVASGSLVISRPAPELETSHSGRMLAFMPIASLQNGKWLSVDRSTGTLSLMEGEKAVVVHKGEGINQLELQPGIYQLLHKQKHALWHAPDTYFTERELPVPPQGDRTRFRRGALGSYVMFITRESPIHSGPVFLDEIGGVRLAENQLARLYYSLNIGSLIEVK